MRSAAAERRIRQHHLVTIFLLDVGQILGERIGMDDVGRLDAVQDHVHDRDDVGERLLFLAVKSAVLQRVDILGRQLLVALHEVERLAEETRRAAGAIVNSLADLRLHHLHDRADERARGVILAAVAPGVAHVLDLGFIQMRQLMLLVLRTEVQLIDVVDDLAQVVAALNLVLYLAEDFADFVLDSVRTAGL